MRANPSLRPLSLFLALTLATPLLAAAQNAPARAARIKVTAEQANLREKPDIGSSIVQQIPEGTVLEADKKEGEWYFVRYALEDGGVIGGWIHESLVEVVEPARPAPDTAGRPAEKPAERPARPARTRPKLPPLEFRSGSVPLEISFSLGAATLAPRDLNNAAHGFAGLTAASGGLAALDDAQTLRAAPVFGFELSYRIDSRWTIGLGADYLRGANGDEIELAGVGVTETIATRPSARVVPVKVIARFYPGAGFYVRGALGLYAVKAGYLYRRESAGVWEQWKGSASTTGLGGEAAFGGEWDIAPRTLLFLEAGLRMASVAGLTGQNTYTGSGGESVREAGTLYYFRQTADDESDYPMVLVQANPPSGPDISNVRRARVNVSGTSFRVGVRYRF
jgi:hypothetical protein